ncbi:hypothetical protein TVAG_029340 [Trichomonas vaginalis G3]|uniref:Uncharacterized protein n=1 Tax=Trichomonas vaginalis (strain ATCC PRA-98 / G3) TaxID=412133 RepID=A2F526_TRIV3|nr:hypothetical protein TVAGG3_0594860 [Trichomonas vaginalis G3]EAY00030.1 hypothetical protein TVAG_029340 [Trichomonas vaginalis G3]KAI5523531.1 hypothetical protein TVAGG3_0594860 [Trichomonas vaginalis G3]|eukprot:XP_001312959.1 hypothetical protein [Trichomonas vaginalis G3]
MSFPELMTAMDAAIAAHNETGDMLYLGKGNKQGIETCKRVLFLLKQYRDKSEWKKPSAIAYQPLFDKIKNHCKIIRGKYPNNEEKLIYVFLRKLIPGKIAPLNFPILSQLSLCSVPVEIVNSKFKPAPITAYIDGYYNFVIPIGGNVVRIPLIPKEGTTPVTLPPSIRFLGSEEEKKNAQKFVVAQAPKIGRLYQLHSFISVLSNSDPRLGPMAGFKDAVASFDLSFATAICALAYDDKSKQLIPRLVNVLGCSTLLDHFLRVLITNSRLVVSSTIPEDNTEFTALVNLFVSPSFDWADDITAINEISLGELIQKLCEEKLTVLPDLSKYVLRAALVISCYADKSGDLALAMFMELVVRPFAKKVYLDSDYITEKENILKHAPESDEIAEIIKRAIVSVLGMDIQIKMSPTAVKRDVQKLYDFTVSHVDPFVRLVISLNGRPKEKNPVMQSMLFGYKLYLDNEVDDEDDD